MQEEDAADYTPASKKVHLGYSDFSLDVTFFGTVIFKILI